MRLVFREKRRSGLISNFWVVRVSVIVSVQSTTGQNVSFDMRSTPYPADFTSTEGRFDSVDNLQFKESHFNQSFPATTKRSTETMARFKN